MSLPKFSDYQVNQEYNSYSLDAHRVWQESLNRAIALNISLGHHMHSAYSSGLSALELKHSIPRIEDINRLLKPTGWQTICVNGYIPSFEYSQLISNNIFPFSRVIRKFEHIDYSPVPDLVHDVIGHLPMLFCKEYRDFLQRLASVMVQAAPNQLDAELYNANNTLSLLKNDTNASPESVLEAEQKLLSIHQSLQSSASEVALLSRFYLWTIEFGLLGTPRNFQIYGAGLLSAPNEFKSVCNNVSPILPCDLAILNKDINFTELQDQYFVAEDFHQLNDILTDYESKRLGRE